MRKKSRVTRRGFLQVSGLAGGYFAAGMRPSCIAEEGDAPGEDPPPVTRMLARYVVSSQPADIPEAVRKEAVRSILNWVGCAVGGSRHETVECTLAALSEFSGPRQASVLGRKERLDILQAALVNGISSHVLDYDDTHLRTVIHPAGPVAPAILALAERQPMTGAEFLHAFILGVEVECRIGRIVYPEHYDAGWHISGTAGIFGAAAAAGKILGLSEQQMVWALGTAATQSSGLREMFGSMCKSLHVGRAARDGLAAAILACKNFTSSDRGIEASRGFAYVLSPARNFAAGTDGLGKAFEIAQNTYKPFACGIVIHPVIDGCIQLRNQHQLKPEQIKAISLKVNPLVLELTGKKSPSSGLEGKFSVYHSAAVAILRGAAGIREYSDEVVRDPGIVSLRERVSASVDRSVREDEAFISIILNDSRELQLHVEHAVGSLDRPMSDSDLEAKFHGLADGVLTRSRQDKLIQLCWSTASLKDVAAIPRASVL